MDKGKVIHCNKKTTFVETLIALSLFPIVLGFFWFFELQDPSKDGVITLSVITLFVGVFTYLFIFLSDKSPKKKYVFYEVGVACYEKKQLITFIPYSDFIFVEFYRKIRRSTNSNGTTRRTEECCLAFWCLDATYVELHVKNSQQEFERVWEEILLNCPSLRNQLECYMVDNESKKIHDRLKNESYLRKERS